VIEGEGERTLTFAFDHHHGSKAAIATVIFPYPVQSDLVTGSRNSAPVTYHQSLILNTAVRPQHIPITVDGLRDGLFA
jgi:hypothetical protein